MKRLLLLSAIVALLLPAAPRAEARVDVSINFFYDNLRDDGYWLDVEGYGYCWQPTVAVSNRSWRPYADGYWAYTNVGWTWVSYEPFGWATYHYGRWARLRNHGWVWVPGYEWGPAWVSWRTGGNYVGWAPLPPRRHGRGGEVVYSGRAISGYVDIEFDIGPSYYNFVDVRYIGAPVLSRHIFAPTRNVAYINQTVNVTNITYTNNVFHNYGPDYNRLSAYSTQPIQRLSLQRNTETTSRRGAEAGGFNRVQGNQLIVAAPQRLEQPAQPVAPPAVKTRVEEPNVETGWSDVTDEKARANIRAKMQKEDRTAVPPPDIQPQNPEALKAAAEATPPAAAAPSPAVDPETAEAAAATAGGTSNQDRGQRSQRIGDAAPEPLDPATRPQATPPAPDAAAAETAATPARGKDRREQRPQVRQPQTPAAAEEAQERAAAPDADARAGAGADRRARGKQREQQQPARDIPPASVTSEPAAAPQEPDAPAQSAGAPSRDDRGPRQNRQRPVREAAPEAEAPSRAPVIQPQIDEPVRRQRVSPPQDEQPEARGRGRKADRDVPPAVTRPPDVPPQPPQPRVREMPPRQQPPAQVVPPSAPRGEAAPQRGGERERPERGRGRQKKDDTPEGEEE